MSRSVHPFQVTNKRNNKDLNFVMEYKHIFEKKVSGSWYQTIPSRTLGQNLANRGILPATGAKATDMPISKAKSIGLIRVLVLIPTRKLVINTDFAPIH